MIIIVIYDLIRIKYENNLSLRLFFIGEKLILCNETWLLSNDDQLIQMNDTEMIARLVQYEDIMVKSIGNGCLEWKKEFNRTHLSVRNFHIRWIFKKLCNPNLQWVLGVFSSFFACLHAWCSIHLSDHSQ